jgi:hypothetical protein
LEPKGITPSSVSLSIVVDIKMAAPQTAGIPDDFKGLRACLRCSLVKTFEQVSLSIKFVFKFDAITFCVQFLDRGCDNCEFLGMEGNTDRAQEVFRYISEPNLSLDC